MRHPSRRRRPLDAVRRAAVRTVALGVVVLVALAAVGAVDFIDAGGSHRFFALAFFTGFAFADFLGTSTGGTMMGAGFFRFSR